MNFTDLPLGERRSALITTKTRIEARLYQLSVERDAALKDLSLTEASLVALQGLDSGSSAQVPSNDNQ